MWIKNIRRDWWGEEETRRAHNEVILKKWTAQLEKLNHITSWKESLKRPSFKNPKPADSRDKDELLKIKLNKHFTARKVTKNIFWSNFHQHHWHSQAEQTLV